MLGGSAPGEDRRANRAHGVAELELEVVDVLLDGLVLVLVLVELDDDDVNRPIVIVTALFLLAVDPPAGFWEMTFPSWFGLLTLWVLRWTVKPAACSALAAPSAGSPTTGGTVAVVGADATTMVTVEPGATRVRHPDPD